MCVCVCVRPLIKALQDFADTHRTRSMPSRASSVFTVSRVQTASLPIQTPWSLAPISAPHIQAGLLRTTPCVYSACGIWMYVHCKQKYVSTLRAACNADQRQTEGKRGKLYQLYFTVLVWWKHIRYINIVKAACKMLIGALVFSEKKNTWFY